MIPALKSALSALRARFRDQRPIRIADEALERAAAHCDALAALYPRTDVGFDTGYRMAAQRAAKNIRSMKGPQ